GLCKEIAEHGLTRKYSATITQVSVPAVGCVLQKTPSSYIGGGCQAVSYVRRHPDIGVASDQYRQVGASASALRSRFHFPVIPSLIRCNQCVVRTAPQP